MDTKEIGRKLLMLRGNRTQESVAKDLGISAQALSAYENGTRMPRDELKIKIAEYYHQTVASIFFEQ